MYLSFPVASQQTSNLWFAHLWVESNTYLENIDTLIWTEKQEKPNLICDAGILDLGPIYLYLESKARF